MITFLTIILILGIIYTIIKSIQLIPGIKDLSKLPQDFQNALNKGDLELSDKAKRVILITSLSLVVLFQIALSILLIIAIQ